MKIEIYCDGSCEPNSGEGTWGVAVIINGELFHSEANHEKHTTNNVMELYALNYALTLAMEFAAPITIYSDSEYSIKCITEWCYKWKAKQWRIKKNTRVIAEANEKYDMIKDRVQVKWVRSHSGNKWNEFVDQLCNKVRRQHSLINH